MELQWEKMDAFVTSLEEELTELNSITMERDFKEN